jgi:peptidoglycan-associated lipoprotein
MTLLGASANQIRTSSYGEERPQDPGHDEAAYGQNRRVEVRY